VDIILLSVCLDKRVHFIRSHTAALSDYAPLYFLFQPGLLPDNQDWGKIQFVGSSVRLLALVS
jgi:hypothetical protein